MNDLPARRYNEKEVSRLLKRASELQRSSPSTPNPAGLTLRELEDIAREAGLDPVLLRQAAVELDSRNVGSGTAARWLGGPVRLTIERTIEGEVDENVFFNIILLFENAFGGPGQVGYVGRTFSWTSTRPNSGRTQQVRISSRDGQTSIRIEENFGQLAGGLYGGVLGGVGGGVGIGVGATLGGVLGSAALAVGFPLVIIGGCYAILRRSFGAYIARRKQILDQLMVDIIAALH